MKTKKESSLQMAIELIKATGGKKNTASLLKAVFDEIQQIRKD